MAYRKPFSKNLYGKYDGVAKDTLINHLLKDGHVLIDSTESYDADVVTEKLGEKHYSEAEVKTAWKGDWPDIIQMLLDAGANRKLRNNYHKTPLEYAKDNKRTQTMAILKGGKGKKGKQKVKPGNALAAPTVMGRLLAQGARGKQDRRLKAGFEEDADKTVTLHIGEHLLILYPAAHACHQAWAAVC